MSSVAIFENMDKILNERSRNVYFSMGSFALSKDMPKWLKQGDRRLSLFITHAGMNSALEATFYGKPLVAVPLFSDQILNAKSLEKNHILEKLKRQLGISTDKLNMPALRCYDFTSVLYCYAICWTCIQQSRSRAKGKD
ncbi:unnamed protein product [Nippostrongylus brasiliensis]|uniref:glucuronosyltransferase n=1 Tax=Nippostrongylus brasiliensis TaxID=27835 RepID=A0A0N4YX39_NIPBR|nr:unnamed protein product [Nippostrongylus brasiliensis]